MEALKFPTPRYADKEGHHKARAKSTGVIRSGMPRELDKHDIASHFSTELKNAVKKIPGNIFSKVVVTFPVFNKNVIMTSLPPALKEKVSLTVNGNYYQTPPSEVFAIIKKEWLKEKKPVGPAPKAEAQKILDKSKQARHFIKGKPGS